MRSMKQEVDRMPRKVKGFTLIELIVVMATFSIIMFGAMSLMNPVNKVFVTTSRTESVSAAADNIRRYLELNLRYAECVTITNTEPTIQGLRGFIDSHYDGKVIKDASGALVPASGDLYVIKINNANGGQIDQTRYSYTAGDSKGAYLTDPTINYATVNFTERTEWAVNKAFYEDYHFNVSLGLYELVDNKLELMAGANPVDKDNFSFTITGYPYRYSDDASLLVDRTFTSEIDGMGNTVQYYKYDPGFTFSANMALQNVNDSKTYIAYSWIDDGSGNMINEVDADGNTVFNTIKRMDAGGSCFSQSGITNYVEADEIYIIYTYVGEDIIS